MQYVSLTEQNIRCMSDTNMIPLLLATLVAFAHAEAYVEVRLRTI